MSTALLIIDMQRFFATMTSEALPSILKLCEHFKSSSLPIILTQHGHPPSDFEKPYKNQLIRKWGPNESIHTDSRDHALLPEIREIYEALPPDQRNTIIQKNTYDSFLGLNGDEMLGKVLKEKNIERVVICGVMTDCCCDTTARSAFNRGYETWLVSDACGTASIAQHQAALKGFGFGFGPVLDTAEVLKRLR